MTPLKIFRNVPLLLGLAAAMLPCDTEAAAETVRLIRVVLPPNPSPAMENITRVFARQVRRRCNARVALTGKAPLKLILSIEPGLGAEAFEIAGDGQTGIRVIGNDERGLLYGVGKFLRDSRCGQGGFTPGGWRGTSAPQSPFRALYAATHFMNFYEAAPAPEVQSYVEDLALWGANTVILHFPTWAFNGFDDPAARRNLEQLHSIFRAAKAIGLKVGLVQCPNQGFATAPPEIRAAKFPDDLELRGFHGVNCCPANPAGHAYLLQLYSRLFDEFKDIGLDFLVCWPYDEGGCGCADCRPWGARGYPKLSRELVQAARARFPALHSILSTWVYDTPPAGEWAGLAKFLEADRGWLDYIMADSHTDFPRYPLEQGVPGRLPLLNFPEISMYGRSPWGGYGANPLPSRFEGLWRQARDNLAGGMPYSEGIYEDINKVVCLQLYWHKSRAAADILKEYFAFEFSPEAAPQLMEAARLLEETWTKRGPKSAEAFALLREVEAKLTPQAKAAWRWRILYLRGLIDSELFRRNEKMEGLVLKEAFDELTRIYHAENARSMPVHPPQLPAPGP